MISRLTHRTLATCSRLTVSTARSFGTVAESPSATDAMKASCYMEIDFTIPDKAYAIEAIQKFAAFDIGCLITTDDDGMSVWLREHEFCYSHLIHSPFSVVHLLLGKISGVVSERDMITKVALQGKKAKDCLVKEISTKDLVTATPDDSVEVCMNKMIANDIRHLPILDNEGSVVGLLSIKDCAKAVLAEKEDTINTLSDFALGKGGTFVVD